MPSDAGGGQAHLATVNVRRIWSWGCKDVLKIWRLKSLLIEEIVLSPLFGFYFILFLRIILCLSSTSSFLIWVALELNILAFLPIISNQGVWAFENTIKYFLVQSVASIIFLSSRIMINFLPSYFSDVGTVSILLKLGAAPLHGWFISILKTCSLTVLFFLSTIQKILPLLVCFNLWLKSWVLVLFSVITFILILLSAPGTVNINKILGISSVINLI